MEKERKVGKSEKSNQNIVMNEKFVNHIVMNAKIDPKAVMDLSIFKIGGWNYLQPRLIGITNRDPFFVTQFLERHSASSYQHMKKLMSLREGLHVRMQCYMRQHFADRYWLHEHPGGHASWR